LHIKLFGLNRPPIEQFDWQLIVLLPDAVHRKASNAIPTLPGDRVVGIYDQTVMHVPIETVRVATADAKARAADCAPCLGPKKPC
jgi:hypothetical protein